MKVKFDFTSVTKTKWYEFALRFVIGGAITVIAGLLADRLGPVIGGLFLAFPAIFPASATLIEKHERRKKVELGYNPGNRPTFAVALDSIGATMGAVGMIGFALFVFKFFPKYSEWSTLAVAMLIWCLVSFSLWKLEDSI
jgi:hypothetical protein